MQNDLIFKTGTGKRTLGWLVFLGAGGALIAMIYAIYKHPEAQVASELWSAAAIGVFLLGLMVYGIGIQYVRWSIEGETIVYRRIFRTRTFPISELAGFGKFIMIVTFVPFAHLDLYDRKPKHIARLPISFEDWPRAEAWCAERFRYVVNDGSHIFPKLRFVDTPKA